MSSKVFTIIASVMIFILGATPVTAQTNSASTEDLSPSESLETATESDPTSLEAEELTATGNELTSDQGEVDVSIPDDSSQAMNIGNDVGSIKLSVPGEADGAVVGKSVVYEDTLPGLNVVAQAVEGGARQMFVLDSPEAESSISFSAGNASSLLVANPDGSVGVFDGDGEEIAGIGSPWAVDAEGVELDTHYTVDGNTITQHVDTTNATFPVTADPTVCANKIRWVTWITRSGGRTTLSVRPTRCGRFVGARSGWREAQREAGVRYSGPRASSMWDQYLCHFQFAKGKPNWNLDQWRPDVSYAATVRAGCNPR